MKADHSPIKGLTRVLSADVAKATAVLCDSRTGRRWTVANEPEVLRQALEPFADYELLVCEATGGYELPLLDAAQELGLPAHRADPLKVKRYIASLGGAAKTDDIDAGWLARYGQERGASLALWQKPEPAHSQLVALVRHRADLTDTRTQAKNRRGSPGCQAVAGFLDQQLDFLTQQIKAVDAAIAELIDQQPDLASRRKRLRDIQGVGPVVAHTLLALLPELGHINRRQAASLAGLAPHPTDQDDATATEPQTTAETVSNPCSSSPHSQPQEPKVPSNPSLNASPKTARPSAASSSQPHEKSSSSQTPNSNQTDNPN